MNYEERSGMIGAVQPPPKLLIERLSDGDVTCLRLMGTIDEQFDAPGLAQTITCRYLILDLGGVDRISSFGIRQWIDFVQHIAPRLAGVYYVECSPKVVDQFNMVANFGGAGYIVSFYAPYRCETCDQERRHLFRSDEETPVWRAGQAPATTCQTCSNKEDFDENPAMYFNYVAQQPIQAIPPAVMQFLRVHLNYGQGGQRKLRIEKRIEGRCTYIKLSGDLDSDLKPEKLADGLEGEVVVDLGGILSIDPVGTAHWRKLMRTLDAKTGTDESVERVSFIAVPAVFLERLGKPEDLTRKGQVLSLIIPYNCSRCRATTPKLVDFTMHGDELRAGRVPRIKCALCGGPVTCVVSETWFNRLQTLPQPQVTPDLKSTIARLTAAPAPQPARSTMAGPAMPAPTGAPAASAPSWAPQPMSGPPAQPQAPSWTPQPTPSPLATSGPRSTMGSSIAQSSAAFPRPDLRAASQGTHATPSAPQPPPPQGVFGKLQNIPGLLPGLLVVMLSLSGAIVYRILATPAGRAGEWKVVESSTPKAPLWHDPKFVSDGSKFVGHSTQVADRNDALERADIAAQAELISKLAEELETKDPDWRKVVKPLFSPVQDALKEELDKAQKSVKPTDDQAAAEAQLQPARDHQFELQRRSTAAFKQSFGDGSPPALSQYWEKRTRTLKGAREAGFAASSLIELDKAAFDKLVNLFRQTEAAAKVKVMPFFPLLALRFESSEHGPVVIEVEDGSPLAQAGLKSGDLVLSVLGKPVRTPGDFAKQIDLAVKDLASHDVVLKVQRGKELVDVKLTQAKTAPKKGPVPIKKGGK
ncbi:MAG TPA: PDZ domain-containing protein [Pseudomonadota bacterium]|nr:PDZ domain-containing protein [Pseudomonadota bacterium]